MTKKVLIAGESWMCYTMHVKGFDSFYTSSYEEGVKHLKEAVEKAGYHVDICLTIWLRKIFLLPWKK